MHLPVPIFVKNSMGMYVYCNIPFEKYVGRKIDEIVGRGVYGLWDYELVKVAGRIEDAIRKSDMPARLGGDEFMVVFDDLETRDSAFCLAESILQQFSEVIKLQVHTVKLGASIGIAFYPDHGTSPQELLKNADLALYESKRSGKGRFSSLA